MNEPVTVLGYAVLVVAMVTYQLVGVFRRRTPTLADALEPLRRTVGGRVALVAGWLWVGWHVFVRGHWS